MNGKEFLNAVDLVVKEKHIDKEIIFEAMRNALTSAYKKNAKSKNNNVKVLINENNGDIKVYSYLTVVPDDKMTKEEYEDALFERYAEDDDFETSFSIYYNFNPIPIAVEETRKQLAQAGQPLPKKK